jgi:hypothetical protein|tara:strand:- start:170 stop:406 length:237 start_codon:yes stop_codon:yes gene_type:complete
VYTVEFSHDTAVIVSLDDRDEFNDVEVAITDSGSVFISQHDDEWDSTDVILLSYQQLLDITAALHSTEGMFRIEMRKN